MATFTGGVYVLQGDTEMRCKALVVSYEHGQRSHWRGRSDRAMMPEASLIFSLHVEMIEVRHRPWEWRPEAGAADIQDECSVRATTNV